MNRVFGKSKPKEPPPTLTDAIGSTDGRVDSVEKKIAKLDEELLKYKQQMAKMKDGAGKNAVKQRAMRVLKQKKMFEQQRDQLMQTSFNMEQTHFMTQNMQDTITTVAALKQSAKETKKQFKQIDISEIDTVYDDLEDLMDQHNEIQEIMGRSYGIQDDIDEADLDAELEALGDELFESGTDDLSYLDEATAAPDVPTAAPAAKKQQGPMKLDEFGLPEVPM